MSGIVPKERAAIAAVLSAMALVVLDAGIVGVALPTIAGALGATPARAMLVVSAYQVALLIGLLPCAHLADRIGHKRLFVGGVVLFAGSATVCAVAPTLPFLVAARALQGLGGAAIMALGMALLRLALGSERLGAAIGWNALVVACCSALGPLAGGLALSLISWRWLFVIALPIGALALIMARGLPRSKATSRSVDIVSIALYAAIAGCMLVSLEWAQVELAPALAVAAGALACVLWLFARERNKNAPIVPFDLLALSTIRKSVAASAFFFTGQAAGLLALPVYLQLSLGRSATTAGLVVAAWPLAVAATSGAANRLASRFASGLLCAAGGIVLAAGLAAAALWPVKDSIAPLVGCAIVCGMGFGLFQVPNNRSIFLSAPPERGAAAGGLQGTARLAGQTAGALLVGFVLSAAPIATAPRVAMGIAAFTALCAAWVSWPRAPVGECQGSRTSEFGAAAAHSYQGSRQAAGCQR